MQKPVEGIYKTRSATTNPTLNKIFEAGRNGTTIRSTAKISDLLKKNNGVIYYISLLPRN